MSYELEKGLHTQRQVLINIFMSKTGHAQVSKFVHVPMDFRCTGVATDESRVDMSVLLVVKVEMNRVNQ